MRQEEEGVYKILALNCIPNWNFLVKGPFWDNCSSQSAGFYSRRASILRLILRLRLNFN